MPPMDRVGVVLDTPYVLHSWTPPAIEKAVRPFYPAWSGDRYRSLLTRLGVPTDTRLTDMSRGTGMKLQMAVALAHEPTLLVLDEPTSGLDPLARDEFIDLVAEFMQEESRAVLFSTHITSDLERIADYVAVLDRGRLLTSAPTPDCSPATDSCAAAPTTSPTRCARRSTGCANTEPVSRVWRSRTRPMAGGAASCANSRRSIRSSSASPEADGHERPARRRRVPGPRRARWRRGGAAPGPDGARSPHDLDGGGVGAGRGAGHRRVRRRRHPHRARRDVGPAVCAGAVAGGRDRQRGTPAQHRRPVPANGRRRALRVDGPAPHDDRGGVHPRDLGRGCAAGPARLRVPGHPVDRQRRDPVRARRRRAGPDPIQRRHRLRGHARRGGAVRGRDDRRARLLCWMHASTRASTGCTPRWRRSVSSGVPGGAC